ncbi:hypothetical protein RPO_06005 [Rickettsia rickettsii str. Arizona]|nr:hypothetical protein A1G_05945 [Rickettsia rickettsii str. 'Sheila Smith']AFB21780.1 hypothetical protein RPN_01045 [Rickettsia rickettsii str. Brazil]AFB24002.1 hypothetical protein RPL_05990 [Rickettsia rickettsii str. Colombia]AFB25347.1 hypothetical protein RPO_06005 [Rickettsia rickettsii str. Arizona]AFB28026.1 hypothetical protein RPJ_05950 [Rickettsia rickettsii str. Hino]AFB30687.1 hypothetical protein RPM_05985 [Rickettsia rickettsii str. Hauke]AJG33423.1 hypothetical protein RRR
MNEYIKQRKLNKILKDSVSLIHTLMTKCGWVKDRQKGSHQIWYLPKGNRLSIHTFGNMEKEYQV